MCSNPPRARTFPGLAIVLGLVSLSLALPAHAGWHPRSDGGKSASHHAQGSGAHDGPAYAASTWGHGHRHGHHWRPWYHWRPWHGWWGWHPWRHDRPVCHYLAGLMEQAPSENELQRIRFFAALFRCELPDPEPSEPEPTEAPPPDAAILDENGVGIADIGSLELDHGVFRVPFTASLADAVVILGPPTARDGEPGVAQLEGVDADGFRVRFAEWSYLDGTHEMEKVSYLVLAPGRHRLSDGSEWEVGTLELAAAGTFGNLTFSAPFQAAPAVFLSAQAAGDGDPVVVRARDVTATGFQAALFEEEGADGVHDPKRVGYLAVVSPGGSGRVETVTGSRPYLARHVAVDDQPLPVLSATLWLEEEASVDDETTHAEETLAFLAIGPEVFAQDLSSVDLDTAAVRRRAPEVGPVMEWGTLPDVDDAWHTVPLAREYTDPVVVVGAMSGNELDPGVLRVQNVGVDAFEVRIQEWSYLDQVHAPERAFYLVADPGIQSLGGLMVEAGHVDTNAVVAEGMQDVGFALPFADVPGVFASVMTRNDNRPVMVRISDRTVDGFRMAMQEEETQKTSRGLETIGWIAIQAGSGVTTDGRVVEVLDASVDHNPLPVPFGAVMSGRLPSMLAQVGSGMGLDPVVARYLDLGPDGVTLKAEEEQSFDAEVAHRFEDVTVFVAE